MLIHRGDRPLRPLSGACSLSSHPFHLKPLPSAGIARLRNGTYGLLRHPGRPNLALHGYVALARATPPAGLPVLRPFKIFHACCRHYPGGTVSVLASTRLPDRWTACPRNPGGSAIRVTRFEACSAFNRINAAHVVAEPPRAALCRRSASCRCRYLHRPLRSYRLERQLPGGIRTRCTAMAPCHRRTE